MRILGIDPGFGTVGFGVVDKISGANIKFVGSGIIKTLPTLTFPERLSEIAEDLCVILQKYKPDVCAIEELFFARNTTTALKVAEARGVIIYNLHKFGSEIFSYTPLQVKLSITGNGRADKADIKKMVNMTFGSTNRLGNDDAYDALAVAITHAQASALINPTNYVGSIK